MCVLAYTLPNANRPLVLRGTSSLRVSKSSCEDTAYGSRPLVCDHSVCLSARPHEDRSDPPHVLTGFSRQGASTGPIGIGG